MQEKDLILAAKIIGTHGVKGYLKVVSFIENNDNLFLYNTILKDGSTIKLEKKFNSSDNLVVCMLENVTSKEEGAKLKNTEIFIKRKDLPELIKDEFYSIDLIGAEVFSNSKLIGHVSGMQFHKLLKNCILEIQIINKNIIHLAEFTKNNFFNSDENLNNDKIKLHINPSTIEYLNHI